VIQTFFHSGRVADLILVVMAVEFAFLYGRGRSRPDPVRATDLLFAIGPGACIVLALRAALTGAAPVWIGAALAASLPLHLADLARRKL
jgi:hypothetical protein